jgi:hypothetical protein
MQEEGTSPQSSPTPGSPTSGSSIDGMTPGNIPAEVTTRLSDINVLLQSLKIHAQSGGLTDDAPKERGPVKTVKRVVRRLMRPFWDRQTTYNLANAELVDRFARLFSTIEERPTNLYLRAIHIAEDKLNGLTRLMRHELAARDSKINDLEARLQKIESLQKPEFVGKQEN